MYYFLYKTVWIFTLLPLGVLYLLSDIFYPIVYYIVGYRKQVVRTNLSKSFPNKTVKERKLIERKFYRFFCDLFVETIKEMNISEAEIKRRMTYGNTQVILDEYEKGKSVMIMTSHYGNWEWTLAFPLFMPGTNSSNPIYKKQNNKKVDYFINSLRSKFGAELIEKRALLRVMLRFKQEDKLGNFWMISDQSTGGQPVNYYSNFLNQDTATLTGTEQLAKRFDYPVFYADITLIKRGYYHCEFIPLSLEPTKTAEFEITEKYMQILQKRIEDNPEYWLWTHRRWKYGR